MPLRFRLRLRAAEIRHAAGGVASRPCFPTCRPTMRCASVSRVSTSYRSSPMTRALCSPSSAMQPSGVGRRSTARRCGRLAHEIRDVGVAALTRRRRAVVELGGPSPRGRSHDRPSAGDARSGEHRDRVGDRNAVPASGVRDRSGVRAGRPARRAGNRPPVGVRPPYVERIRSCICRRSSSDHSSGMSPCASRPWSSMCLHSSPSPAVRNDPGHPCIPGKSAHPYEYCMIPSWR